MTEPRPTRPKDVGLTRACPPFAALQDICSRALTYRILVGVNKIEFWILSGVPLDAFLRGQRHQKDAAASVGCEGCTEFFKYWYMGTEPSHGTFLLQYS